MDIFTGRQAMITDELYYRHFSLAQIENRIYAEWCKKRGISYSWLLILDMIFRATDDIEPAMISDSLFIPRQTMTSLLDQMEKNGLIVRQRSQTDRRRINLSLTEKGQETIVGILKELAVQENIIVGEISREKMAVFNEIYADIVSRLKSRLMNGD